MSFKRHIPRWIKASVIDYLKRHMLPNWPIYFEEFSEKINEGKTPNSIDVRIEIPDFMSPGTKFEGEVEFTINLLLTWQFDLQNVYGLQTATGYYIEVLDQHLCISKLGNESGDDKSFWETAQCMYDQPLSADALGPVDPAVQKYESVIQSYYKITYLDEGA